MQNNTEEGSNRELYRPPMRSKKFVNGVPEGWNKDLWNALTQKLNSLSKEEILKAYDTLGIHFSGPAEEISKDDLIGAADELIPDEAMRLFGIDLEK
ncbi:MAG: hypothetical protein AAB617_03235 [Patescibacteria group bacterium]